MMTFYDVPRRRNILHGCERSYRVVFTSRRVEQSVLRTVLLAPRIREARAREVRHVVG